MADDFLIRIIPEGFSGTGVSSAGGSSVPSGVGSVAGISKSVGNAFGTVLKGLGIVGGIGIVVGILSSMKSLLDLVSSFLKLISTLLRPVERVITTLLMPILFILKPFVVLVNQVMSPFIKLAMDVMRAGHEKLKSGDITGAMGNFAAAGGIALNGLTAVVMAVSAELVKTAVDIIFSGISVVTNALISVAQTGISLILSLFGVSSEKVDEVFNMLRTSVNDSALQAGNIVKGVIDTIFGNAVAIISAQSVFTAESLGVSTEKFQEDAKLMIMSVFSGAKGLSATFDTAVGLAEGFGKMANDAINGTFNNPDGITTSFTNAIGNFQNEGVKKIGSAVSAFNKEFDKLKGSSGGSSSNRGFFERAVDATYGNVARAIDRTLGT